MCQVKLLGLLALQLVTISWAEELSAKVNLQFMLAEIPMQPILLWIICLTLGIWLVYLSRVVSVQQGIESVVPTGCPDAD